jgi:hypothetical protein
MVFIQDPVTKTAYSLNLDDKTAQKIPFAASVPGGDDKRIEIGVVHSADDPTPDGPVFSTQTFAMRAAPSKANPATTEDLGSETMEGLAVTGKRITQTIPAGQVGNARPIETMTEVWTSPELKTVIYSKQTDPAMGDNTFQLSNVSRDEPDPSLFTVPAGFKIVDDPGVMVRRPAPQN